jgi:uncharacterized membrane protein YdjX (TVP38/TMEM64 family)
VTRRIALGISVAVLALGVGLRLAGVQVSAASVAQSVRAAGTSTWGPVVYLALYLVFTSVAVPGILFHIAGGVIWGFWPGVLINVVAANIGSNFQFAAGRLFGAGPLERLVERRGLMKYFAHSRTEGLWAMIAIRQLPLPASLVNVAAGSSAMPWWHFLIGSGLGGLVPQVVWTWFAGEVFHDPTAVPAEILFKAVAAGALALLIAFGTRMVVAGIRRGGAKP